MSEIKNGGLDQYGAESFEQQQFGTAGVEGVKKASMILKCKLKSLTCKTYDHNARPSQTDRETNEHHGNSATVRSNERIVC